MSAMSLIGTTWVRLSPVIMRWSYVADMLSNFCLPPCTAAGWTTRASHEDIDRRGFFKGSTHGARTLRRTVQSPRLGRPGRPSASVQLARALPVYVPA